MSVAGVGGGASKESQPEPIVPGSAVSALLVRGDLQIAATCTTTYVDANQLLGVRPSDHAVRRRLHADDEGAGPGYSSLSTERIQNCEHDGDGGLDYR